MCTREYVHLCTRLRALTTVCTCTCICTVLVVHMCTCTRACHVQYLCCSCFVMTVCSTHGMHSARHHALSTVLPHTLFAAQRGLDGACSTTLATSLPRRTSCTVLFPLHSAARISCVSLATVSPHALFAALRGLDVACGTTLVSSFAST